MVKCQSYLIYNMLFSFIFTFFSRTQISHMINIYLLVHCHIIRSVEKSERRQQKETEIYAWEGKVPPIRLVSGNGVRE